MNAHDSGCDHQRIDDFLNSDHVGLDDPDLVDHLDSCAMCRAYMERQAAEPEGWSKAAELLQPNEFDHASTAEYSAATIGDQRVARSGAIQNVLDSLTPSDDPHRLGRLGGYEVSGVVGVGGMGVVLKAVDPSLDRVVAIKVMAPHLANNATARKRFSREAKAAAAVLHPNVIPIHCVSSDDAIPYLVMAYIRGGSLQKRLEHEGPLPTVEILRIGSQIAAGLAAAHEQGLVHRDIKPENILLEEGVERVALTDFGLARAVDDASVTREGTIAGTPQYMSPEQARGESVDQKSDLFSLGSVLYALCTGRPPFRADSSYGVMRRISDSAPTPIRELNSDIPDWLAGIIEKLMAKEKAERFESAGEVHELLEACLSHVQQPTTVELPFQLLAMNKPSESKGGLLSRLYKKAVDVGIMTPKEGEMQARRLADLLWFLPVVVIILIGFWSHRHLGSDGIVGVLLGLYGLAYLAIFVPRLDTETTPPLRRIISKHWKAVAILFLACIVGGGLEMFARGLFSRKDSAFLMVGGGCASKGEGWCFSSGSIYLHRDEPGVIFGVYEDPAGNRQFSYVVLFRHNVGDFPQVSTANQAGLTFCGEVAAIKDGITIDGKSIELALEVHVDRHRIKSTEMAVDGKAIDASKGKLFLVDLTSDVVPWDQIDAKFPGNLPDPHDMVGDTELVSKVARQITQLLTRENDQVREFLAGGALRSGAGGFEGQNSGALSDHEKIQGAWQLTYVEENGRPIQPPQEVPEEERRLEFAEETVTGPGRNNAATYKLDPSTTPKSIDMTEDGRRKLGIYDLQGDTLRICVAEGQAERPTAFDSQPDSPNNVMILKRLPSELEQRRRHTLDRLDWTGGSPEDRYVRDLLVAAVQKATPTSLGSPTLVSAAFRGSVDEKRGSIIVDWISAAPVANGLLLNMQDGGSSLFSFEDLYLKANERQSKDMVVFQAAIDGKSHPLDWPKIKLQAIDTVQLTKDAEPVGNVCKFRLPQETHGREVAAAYFEAFITGATTKANELVAVPFLLDGTIVKTKARVEEAHRDVLESKGKRPVPKYKLALTDKAAKLDRGVFPPYVVFRVTNYGDDEPVDIYVSQGEAPKIIGIID